MSFPDLQNKNLHKLINNNKKNNVQNVRDNPYIATRVFNIQMKLIMNKFFRRLPGYKWGFYRLEFQNRGTVHAHGFVRIEIEGDKQIEDYGQRAKQIHEKLKSTRDIGVHERRRLLEEKQKCEQKIIDFNDWLCIEAGRKGAFADFL